MTIQKVIKGNPVLFDSSDWSLIDKYRLRVNPKNGYVMSFKYGNGKSKTLYLSRIVMGVTDTNVHVDHINRNKLDNRRSNLRIATPAQNSYNKDKHRGASKYKGVMTICDRGSTRIIARVVHNKKQHYLGTFETHEAAALAYNEAALKYHGEFANLNTL